jgi:hypothetical protein
VRRLDVVHVAALRGEVVPVDDGVEEANDRERDYITSDQHTPWETSRCHSHIAQARPSIAVHLEQLPTKFPHGSGKCEAGSLHCRPCPKGVASMIPAPVPQNTPCICARQRGVQHEGSDTRGPMPC